MATIHPTELQGKTKPKHIFISYGSKETNGANGLPKVEADLKAAGYNVTTYISQGTAHEFQTWRRSFIKWHHFYLNNKTSLQIKSSTMKKLLFALANVLLINISVHSQEPVKPGPAGF